MKPTLRSWSIVGVIVTACVSLSASSEPVLARRGMVASQNRIASEIGARMLEEGGTATDAAVATAFALAVVLPSAGNIGGGGFMVYRPTSGAPIAYDFREVAPAKASATMFMVDGAYRLTCITTATWRSAFLARSPVSTWPGGSRASCRGNGSSIRRSLSHATGSP